MSWRAVVQSFAMTTDQFLYSVVVQFYFDGCTVFTSAVTQLCSCTQFFFGGCSVRDSTVHFSGADFCFTSAVVQSMLRRLYSLCFDTHVYLDPKCTVV